MFASAASTVVTEVIILAILFSSVKSGIVDVAYTTADAFKYGSMLLQNMDPKHNPCDDFYMFACNGYGKNRIDIAAYNISRFNDSFFGDTTGQPDTIKPLPEPTTTPLPNLDGLAARVGFYSERTKMSDDFISFMDKKLVERGGHEIPPIELLRRLYTKATDPGKSSQQKESSLNICFFLELFKNSDLKGLKELYEKFKEINNTEDLIIAAVKNGLSSTVLRFNIGQNNNHDPKTTLTIDSPFFYIGKDNLISLADRAFRVRDFYMEYIRSVLNIFLFGELDVEKVAEKIVLLEINLARFSSIFNEEFTDLKEVKVMDKGYLAEEYPDINLAKIIDQVTGDPPINEITVGDAHYFTKLNSVLKGNLETVKHLIAFKLAEGLGWLLSQELFEKSYKFWWTLGRSVVDQPNRNVFVLRWLAIHVPELVIRFYAKESGLSTYYYSINTTEFSNLVHEVKFALVGQTTLVDNATLNAAIEKVRNMKVIYECPDYIFDDEDFMDVYNFTWNEYGDLFKLITRVKQFKLQSSIKKLQRQSTEMDFIWAFETEPFYISEKNALIIPVMAWQEILKNWGKPLHWKYGEVATLLARKMFSALSYWSSYYDKDGKRHDWMTMSSRTAYEKASFDLSEQYNNPQWNSGYEIDPVKFRDEAIADLGAIRTAFRRFQKAGEGNDLPKTTLPGFVAADGWNANKLLFLAYASPMCEVSSAEEMKDRIVNGYNMPAHLRVNLPLRNLFEFRDTFDCKEDDRMNPYPKITIW